MNSVTQKQVHHYRADKCDALNVQETATKEDFIAEKNLLKQDNAEEEDKNGSGNMVGTKTWNFRLPKTNKASLDNTTHHLSGNGRA